MRRGASGEEAPSLCVMSACTEDPSDPCRFRLSLAASCTPVDRHHDLIVSGRGREQDHYRQRSGERDAGRGLSIVHPVRCPSTTADPGPQSVG
jgi:hypothetical protein